MRHWVPAATATSAPTHAAAGRDLIQMSISGRTRIVGIIGDPVAHSLSPAMHNAAFDALHLDFAYVPFHVRRDALRAAIAGIRALGVAGVNVTVPHKEPIIPLLDSVSDTARRVGAVNTIINRDGRLHGENTDVIGILTALREARVRLRGTQVVVVGAGGVARAAVVALQDGGAAVVTVVNRTPRRARLLAKAFDIPTARVNRAGLSALQDEARLKTVDLVINATSLGLHDEPFLPLRFAASPPHCLFFDLIYGRRTHFLISAAQARRRTLDGSSMLVGQGAAAFTLWTGRRAPLAVMRAALHSK